MLLDRPKSLSDLATEQIRKAIICGEFELGASLSEVCLSNRLGVSKTPIREALAALRLQGLVDFVPQKGAFVFCLSAKQVTQLCDYRNLLESNALDKALSRDCAALTADLTQICDQMANALSGGQFDLYLQLDADFHEAFFTHGGNDFLHAGYKTVRDMVATMRTHLSKKTDRTSKSFAEHQRILAHLRAGEISKAKSVLRNQITRGERAYAELGGQRHPHAARKEDAG